MKSPKKPAAKPAVKQTPPEDIPVVQPELIRIDELKEKSVDSPSAGLGDTIAKITGALGIKQCETCIKRKEILNRQFSYLELSRDVTEEEGLFMQRLNIRPGYIADADIAPLFALYNSLFNKRLTACRCGGVVNQIMDTINRSFKYHRQS